MAGSFPLQIPHMNNLAPETYLKPKQVDVARETPRYPSSGGAEEVLNG